MNQQLYMDSEGVIEQAAENLKELLSETTAITQQCLKAITLHVQGVESVHNDWHPIVRVEGEERKHLESLLPKVR
jgi:hypothetical protein